MKLKIEFSLPEGLGQLLCDAIFSKTWNYFEKSPFSHLGSLSTGDKLMHVNCFRTSDQLDKLKRIKEHQNPEIIQWEISGKIEKTIDQRKNLITIRINGSKMRLSNSHISGCEDVEVIKPENFHLVSLFVDHLKLLGWENEGRPFIGRQLEKSKVAP